MIKIGITGGMGSGKSVLGQLFEVFDIPVYIADRESKRLTNESPLIRNELTALFGKEIYTTKGINKNKLASFIFKDPALLRKVNAIIHPVVFQDFESWADKQTTTCCAVESAILFESGFDSFVDLKLMVYAPLSIRIRRIRERDKASVEEIQKRLKNQLSDDIKRSKSDFTILNDEKMALLPQMEIFISFLKETAEDKNMK